MARSPVRACIDRLLPIELLLESMDRSLRENPHNAPALNARALLPCVVPAHPKPALAALTGKLWQPGRTLRVHFMDGDAAVQQRIPQYAEVWSRYAHLHLDFAQDPDAEIRISFTSPGSWSYIGVDALTVPKSRPTMNFGWLTPSTSDEEYSRVVTHEFGHALGCIHEHQNPTAGIPWNKPAVYEYYAGPPNYWTKQQVNTNLFERYSEDLTQFSQFDPASVMLYPIPNALTVGDFETGWNDTLSPVDKQYIAALYPKEAISAIPLAVNAEPIAASIGQVGEVDTFFFVLTQSQTCQIETEGRTDVVASLFGPDDETRPIAQDDNSGRRKNARIVAALKPGTYTIRIRHYSLTGLGDYTISVRSAE